MTEQPQHSRPVSSFGSMMIAGLIAGEVSAAIVGSLVWFLFSKDREQGRAGRFQEVANDAESETLEAAKRNAARLQISVLTHACQAFEIEQGERPMALVSLMEPKGENPPKLN